MVQQDVARLRLERAPQLVRVERLPRRRPRVLLVDDDGLAVDFQRDDLDITRLLELEAVELLDHGVGDADAGRLRTRAVSAARRGEGIDAMRVSAGEQESMRCVAGGDARRRVSAGENAEFFRGARRGAFACKCVSAAGSELTVARRRRKE